MDFYNIYLNLFFGALWFKQKILIYTSMHTYSENGSTWVNKKGLIWFVSTVNSYCTVHIQRITSLPLSSIYYYCDGKKIKLWKIIKFEFFVRFRMAGTFLYCLSWCSFAFQMCFAVLSLAAGLYYVAEIIEEFTAATKR